MTDAFRKDTHTKLGEKMVRLLIYTLPITFIS
jgi:hypothetical protein